MKNILISPKITKNKHNSITCEIENNWNTFFRKKKINLLTLNFDQNFEFKIKKANLSGIILHGGNTLTKFSKEKENKIRKKIDTKLLLHGIKRKIPILGVCYGFQLIAEYFGSEIFKIRGHVNTKQTLNFKKKTLQNKIKVNSFHNYAIYKLHKNFNEIVRCKDKSIEYAFSKNNKIMCTMFHPERKNWDKSFVRKMVFNHFKI